VVRGSLENSVPCQLKRHTNFKVPVDFRGLSVYQLKFIDLCPQKMFQRRNPLWMPHMCRHYRIPKTPPFFLSFPFFYNKHLEGESYIIHTIFVILDVWGICQIFVCRKELFKHTTLAYDNVIYYRADALNVTLEWRNVNITRRASASAFCPFELYGCECICKSAKERRKRNQRHS